MPYTLIHHQVEDYQRWRYAFDDHDKARRAAGSLGGRVFQDAGNPEQVTVILEWDTLENARAFATSPELKKVMEAAGVLGKPTVRYLEEVEGAIA